MPRSRLCILISLVAASLAVVVGSSAGAQTMDVSGYVDVRSAVVPSTQQSYRDGGLGKLEYEGHSPNSFASTAIDGRLVIDDGLSAHATVRAGPDQKNVIDLIESYVRYEVQPAAGWRWFSKTGAFFPPISLENESVGWTSPWSITPSAINSWVGEELRTVGGETNLEWRYGAGAFTITGAILGWNDPAGVLLADRGWAFDSRPTGLFGSLRLPDALARSRRHAGPLTEEPFHEVDDEPGWYAGLSWQLDTFGRINLLRYENRADPSRVRRGQTAWRTDFTSAGVEADIGDFVVLSQAMVGFTEIAPTPTFNSDTDFEAAYLLVGRYFGKFRVAGRIDVFATQERHQGGSTLGEHGRAFTASLGYLPMHWLRLSLEAIAVESQRRQRTVVGRAPYAGEFQLQLAMRVFF